MNPSPPDHPARRIHDSLPQEIRDHLPEEQE